ncbi:sugar transferase [Flavihumibacter sp. ZG627]|uniref:sugar transferase n=1 Tax=Flavihumibacter sp. ZG627 TaxID=1463156 RepID=UPI0006947D59|nr:sugar transferase [Flavihumibacter sp. ZG627]
MEQTLHLTHPSPQTATYKRYSVFREPETAPVVKIHSREFFYIGRNTRRIDYLVNLFDGGYAAETINKGITILQRLESGQKIVPAAFIVDSCIALGEVEILSKYLASVERFRAIPVIMDSSDNSRDYGDPSLLMHLFDDITDTRKADAKLLHRISFLQKVKVRRIGQQAKKPVYNYADSFTGMGPTGRRIFDISVALLAIVITIPVMLLIAIAIKLESKGPALYISKRAGKGYRIFNFFKFRTMKCGAESQLDQLRHLNIFNEEKGKVFFKVTDDPRVTRIGKFLRNSSLDELPQLFNVLLGDMSIVGNRPLPLYEAAMLTTDEWSERFMAPAGMTGLWQIRKKDRHFMCVQERINLDITYSKKQNFFFDLWIIANTPPALIQKANV